MTKTAATPDYAFTTPELLEVAGISRRQLQHLEDEGALRPRKTGKLGRGYCGIWTLMEAVGIGYYRAFVDAGCHKSWAREACRCVSEMHPGPLHLAFAEGHTLLALLPDGRHRLVQPYLKPAASRELRLRAAQLNLKTTYMRTVKKVKELADRLAQSENT